MRRLATHELLELATQLGAQTIIDLSWLEETRPTDAAVVDAMAELLVSIVETRPFDRRNDSIGIAATDLLARLNGRTLDLEPSGEVVALIARIRDGLPFADVRTWLECRIAARPWVVGPRCPSCSMPLREALHAQLVGRLILPTCGGCGDPIGRPHRSRPLQEA